MATLQLPIPLYFGLQPTLSDHPATPTPIKPQPVTWVKLRDLPSPYSFDQALLLCQEDGDRWITWVPDFGEMTLSADQFELV